MSYTSDAGNSGGWSVSYGGSQITVTPPSTGTAPIGATFTANYATNVLFSGGDLSYYYGTGPNVTFLIAQPPPTKPVPGSAAFGWQGSAGGVNTGNGDKTTALPLVGWTQRGGMAVSCALIHNSQAAVYGPNDTYGAKWRLSYFSYLSSGPGSGVTLHWDTGLTYIFTNNNGTYTPPYGILDTLTAGSGGTFTLTTTGKAVYSFGFAPSGAGGSAYLSAITDLDGNTLHINHAGGNPAISSLVDASGRTLTYAYDGTGRLASVTDPLNRTWTLTYGGGAGAGNLWCVTLPALNGQAYSTWFGYDGSHDIAATQTPAGHANGYTATFGYNGDCSLAWAKDPLGSQTTFSYGANTTTITDANGHTLTHTYAASRLASVTDALGKTESYVYDYNNILSSTTDKRGNLWGYSSHFSNNTNTSTSTEPPINGVSASSGVTYDPSKANKAVGSVDAIGNTTATTYSTDTHFDVLSTQATGTGSAPFHTSASVSGYTNGLPSTVTDAYGKSSTVTYDTYGPNATSWGYVVGTTSASNGTANVTTSATYNALGWELTGTDGLGNVTTYTYDAWGRVTAVTAPDGTQTTTTYDLDGDTLTATDADAHTLTNVYDGDDRLGQTTDGRGDVVTYTYDGPSGYGSQDGNGQTQYGLLSSKTDGNGHTATYTYTARNEPFQTLYPDGTGESAWYDESDNLIKRQKPDLSYTTYAYDADNRLTDITYPHLHPTHFGYDALGRRTLMTDATGTTAWTYADGLHLTQTVTPYGTVAAPGSSTQTVGYAYDLDGRRTTRSLVGTGSWYYTYFDNGQAKTVQTPYGETTTFAYDGAGRPASRTNGDGTVRTQAYDAASQVTDLYDYTSVSQVAHFHYDYTPAGQVARMTQNGAVTTDYAYDGADQLISEAHAGDGASYSLGFGYDGDGNRLTQTSGGQPYQSFVYDAHDKLLSGNGGGRPTATMRTATRRGWGITAVCTPSPGTTRTG